MGVVDRRRSFQLSEDIVRRQKLDLTGVDPGRVCALLQATPLRRPVPADRSASLGAG